MQTNHPTEPFENEWITTSRGSDGISYQRSAQITWWSILQGVAVGALVSKVPNIFTQVIEQGQWYLLLYTIASFLVIANVWGQMAWVILIARWQISALHTTLILLLGTTLSVACLQVDTPWYWYPADMPPIMRSR